MSRIGARLGTALLAVVLTVSAAPASAAYPDTVAGAHADCGAGNYPLQGHYSISVLEKALATLSTSDVEYTICKDALEAAIRSAEAQTKGTSTHGSTTATGTTGNNNNGNSNSNGNGNGDTNGHDSSGTAPNGSTGGTGPISSQQIDAAVNNGKQPQDLGGVVYTPGAITTHDSSFLGSIPDPVLAVLAALIVSLAVLGGWYLRNVVRARRTG
jgi:hypothetical protein